MDNWNVNFIGQAKKAKKILPLKMLDALKALTEDLIKFGPHQPSWPNYGPLKGMKGMGSKEVYHCHLNKGRPRYVVCWTVEDKRIKIIEVFYAGTHQGAPYE
jgi:hypothetical protein